MTLLLSFPVRPLIGAWLTGVVAAAAVAADPGWLPLFDGQSLAGWRAAENPATFRVVNGAIAADGPRAHLFYVGEAGAAEFEDFELTAEVRARAGANSGIYFHTSWQDEGWPEHGFEIQVNHSARAHDDYLELKKTGSLYGVRNVYRQLVADDEWFRLDVRVQRPRVQVRVNGRLVVDYIEPAPSPNDPPERKRLGRGTFALQGHDPHSQVFFRDLRVRRLPEPEQREPGAAPLDEAAAQRLVLARNNFPLLDLHTHLKGGLTLAEALEISRRTGMGLGIATNGGVGFPIQNDAAANAFIDAMQGQPVFLALQAEGREWVSMFSPRTRARFDYVFTDAMTFTNAAGRRLRLWIPEEADIGPDVDAFMEELVAETVRIITEEPIDIYVNPTFLPDSIATRQEELWTEARMQRVIDAAVRAGVAIEINARYRLPSLRFLKLAKAAGARFTFGTNNTAADDFGDWRYCLEMQRELELRWQDMWVPGHEPSRAQREVARASSSDQH